MTRAAVAFIATPLGAVLAAVAAVIALVQNAMDKNSESANKISKIFSTFSIITDKLLKVLEPLGSFLIDGIAAGFEIAGKMAETAMGWIADSLSFLGFDETAEGVRSFTEDIKNTAAETYKLEKAQKSLATQMSVQQMLNENAKQQAGELIEIAKQQNLTEAERVAALQKAASIEKKNLDERKAIAEENYNIAVREAALKRGLSAEEIEMLQRGNAEYLAKIVKVKDFTQQEIDALTKAQLEKMRLNAQEINMEKQQAERLASITSQNNTILQNQRKTNEQEQRNAKREYARTLQLELDMFMQAQSSKERSIDEELAYLKKVEQQKIAIAKAEFAATEKTHNDKLAQDIKLAKIKADTAKQVAQAAIDNAKLELANYLESHKSKITAKAELTRQLIEEENKRLENIKNQKLKILALELDTNYEIIEAKREANKQLSEADLEYLAQKEQAEKEHTEAVNANNEALKEQEKAKKIAEHDQKLQEDLAQEENEYEQKRILEDDRYNQ